MPSDAPSEAIKAQAVAAYTRFCYQRMSSHGDAADIVTTTLPFPQGYTESYWREQWGDAFDKTRAIYKQALDEVYGKQLVYDDVPIMALSHRLNTGVTENGDVLLGTALPYLQSVASPSDALATDLLSTVTVPLSDAVKALQKVTGLSFDGEALGSMRVEESTQAGTVKTVAVGDATCTGYQIQTAFSLPSAAFEVMVQQDALLFTVRGEGHFVGMSSHGAVAMANDGSSYEEILLYYYPDAVLT